MKRSFGDYRRLVGSVGQGSLWAGPDHLLYVEASGIVLAFKERYRRIDYKNIQALTVSRTSTGLFVTLVLVALLGLLGWGVAASLVEEEQGLAIFCGAVAVPLFIILIVHLAKGPTCVCKLQTAVQVLNLKPLRRLRPATLCINSISELCVRHQQPVTALPEMPQAAQASGIRMAGVSWKPEFPGSRLVLAALALTLVAAVMVFVDLQVNLMPLAIATAVVVLFAAALIVIGAARSISRYQLPSALLASLWGEMATLVLMMLAAYALLINESRTQALKLGKAFSINNSFTPMFDALRHCSEASFADDPPAIAWTMAVLAGLTLLFALIGLPQAMRFSNKQAAAAIPPLTPAQPKDAPPSIRTPVIPSAPPIIQPAANEAADDQLPPHA